MRDRVLKSLVTASCVCLLLATAAPAEAKPALNSGGGVIERTVASVADHVSSLFEAVRAVLFGGDTSGVGVQPKPTPTVGSVIMEPAAETQLAGGDISGIDVIGGPLPIEPA